MHERQLKDLITNFNTTIGGARPRVRQPAAVGPLLAPTLETANSALASLNAAFPPTRAFAREILPGVRETAATIEAAFPWIDQTRRAASSPAELQGLAHDLRPAVSDLAALTRASLDLLPQTDLASRCARDIILPTGDVPITDEFDDGRAELQGVLSRRSSASPARARTSTATARWCASRRAAARRRCRSARRRARPASCSATRRRAARQPARLPGAPPAYKPDVRCIDNQRPNLNGPGARQVRSDAAAARRRDRARAARRRGEAGQPRRRGLHAPEDDAVRSAIRKHLRDFVAVLVLMVVALAVSAVILSNQRLVLPGWVPDRRQGLLRRQGRARHRAGRHAGPGPDGQHRGRAGRRDLQGRAARRHARS